MELRRSAGRRSSCMSAVAALLAIASGCQTVPLTQAPPGSSGAAATAVAGGEVIIKVASAANESPALAGREAGRALMEQFGPKMQPELVIMSECFEGEAAKKKALRGVLSQCPKQAVFGLATYGSFTQEGCAVRDSVVLLGIGGKGVSYSWALQEDLGVANLSYDSRKDQIESTLTAAGKALASKLRRTPHDRLLIVMADAHSPKNASLVRGVQEAVGKDFPITGGCANKNAGQTFVYYQGRAYQDSAVALMLSGNLKAAMAGRKAKANDRVIATAKESAAEAARKLGRAPAAAIAFDCAGRKGKLRNIGDELAAIQEAFGKQAPIFGCYCAGEIGPADVSEQTEGVLSSGVGWHVMFTALGTD